MLAQLTGHILRPSASLHEDRSCHDDSPFTVRDDFEAQHGKVNVMRDGMPAGFWGPVHKGEALGKEDARGLMMRQHILDGTLPHALAKKTLESIDCTKPMLDDEQCVRHIAAIAVFFPRRDGKEIAGL